MKVELEQCDKCGSINLKKLPAYTNIGVYGGGGELRQMHFCEDCAKEINVTALHELTKPKAVAGSNA